MSLNVIIGTRSRRLAAFIRTVYRYSLVARIESPGINICSNPLLVPSWTKLHIGRIGNWRTHCRLSSNLSSIGAARIPLRARYCALRHLARIHRPTIPRGRCIKLLGIPDGNQRALTPQRAAGPFTPPQSPLSQESGRELRLHHRKANADKRAAIAALASGLAHEIGTPLGVIRGRAEMLLGSDVDSSELAENVEEIIARVDQITRTMSILLDFARRPTGIRVELDIRPIVEQAIKLLEPQAAPHDIKVITNLGSKPLIVDCDPDQLYEVFVDLATNALEAMIPGPGTLHVNFIADEPNGKVRLSFEDTGPGVAIAIAERVFEPFFTTRGQAGMGLTVSRSIISDHDGELILERNAPGAHFLIILPASTTTHGAAAVQET
jgi:signal transduction histidine kinase